MSSQPKVTVLPYDQSNDSPFGPAMIEHRTAQAGFSELGVYYLTFPKGGYSDPWTLHYEETAFVVEGEASIMVVGDDGETEVRAGVGEIIAIPNGATVRYGGVPGTRLLLSMTPINWRERLAKTDEQGATTPRVLFLTPFHFEKREHDDEFDAVLTPLLDGHGDGKVVADHVDYFESESDDYDAAQARAIVKAVEQANADGYDAIVVACHYDPAVAEARKASRVPVVGPLQLTTAMTTQYGPKFAVITDIPEAVPVISGLIDGYGRGADCVGVTAIGWEGDAILEDPKGAAEAVDRIVADLAAAGEVQSVVIGCTIVSSAYERNRRLFPDRGVVVLNSNLVTVKGAAALATN